MVTMRSIWANRRWTRRKLPPVTRAIALTTAVSVCSHRAPCPGRAAPIGARSHPAVPVHSGVGTDGRSRPASTTAHSGQVASAAWHTDQHHANLSTVVEIAQLLEAGCFESVGFVHQEQVGWLASHGCVWIAVPRGPCTDAIDGPPQIVDGVLHSAWGVGDARRVQHRSPWPAVARWRRAVSIRR